MVLMCRDHRISSRTTRNGRDKILESLTFRSEQSKIINENFRISKIQQVFVLQ